MKNDQVQALWIGSRLSNIEKMSSKSFLANGYDYHLYCYEDIDNVPDGVKILDANSIIPESEIFAYKSGAGKGSYSAFSNLFRYKLIYEKGGFWADTDVISLNKINFEYSDYIFSQEIESIYENRPRGLAIASSFFYCEKKSKLMSDCYDICMSKDKDRVVWGEIGPKLLGQKITEMNLYDFAKPYDFFNPVPWNQVEYLFKPNVNLDPIKEHCYCIHLWNEMWRRKNIDKNSLFDKNCVFEKLKALYL